MSYCQEMNDIQSIPISFGVTSVCAQHGNLDFEYFCVHHDVLLCYKCKESFHCQCEKVMHIDEASKEVTKSYAFLHCIEKISETNESLESFRRECEANIRNVQNNAKKIRESISEAKNKIIENLETKEKSLLAEIDRHTKTCIDEMNATICDIQQILVRTQEQSNVFNLTKDSGSHHKAFILSHTSKNELDNLQNQAEKLYENAKQQNLEYRPTPFDVVLGSVQIIETSKAEFCFPRKQLGSQTPVKDTQHFKSYTLQHNIDLKTVSPKRITGMAAYDNGLLLCDVETSKIYICDRNYIFQDFIKLKHKPWDIAVIPKTSTAVVSMRLESNIKFIDVNKRLIIETIKVDGSELGGIATTAKHIVVGGKGGIIHVLNHEGKSVKNIKPKVRINGAISYLAIINNNNMCFKDEKTLHSMIFDGDINYSYNSLDMRNMRNMVTDPNDNVYVAGRDSANIQRLNTKGQLLRTILSKTELEEPMVICFSLDYSYLFVANKGGKIVLIFKVQ